MDYIINWPKYAMGLCLLNEETLLFFLLPSSSLFLCNNLKSMVTYSIPHIPFSISWISLVGSREIDSTGILNENGGKSETVMENIIVSLEERDCMRELTQKKEAELWWRDGRTFVLFHTLLKNISILPVSPLGTDRRFCLH